MIAGDVERLTKLLLRSVGRLSDETLELLSFCVVSDEQPAV